MFNNIKNWLKRYLNNRNFSLNSNENRGRSYQSKYHPKRITFIVVLSVIMTITVIIANNAINSISPDVNSTAISTASDSSFWFYFLFILGTISLIVYYKVSKKLPTAWMIVGTVGVTVFCWLFWSIKPVYYNAWRDSSLFWPMLIGIGLAGWLSAFKDPLAVWAKKAVLVLCVIGALLSTYYTLGGSEKIFHFITFNSSANSNDVSYDCLITKDSPQIVKLPPRHKSTIWSTEIAKISVTTKIDGENQIVTYSTNSDSDIQAKIHIYPM